MRNSSFGILTAKLLFFPPHFHSDSHYASCKRINDDCKTKAASIMKIIVLFKKYKRVPRFVSEVGNYYLRTYIRAEL